MKINKIPYSVHHINKDSISANAVFTVKTLIENGFEAYIVGGCVRDLILDKKPKDFDVTTNATPEQVKSIFNKRQTVQKYLNEKLDTDVFRHRPTARIIGKRFKIVHVTFGNEIIEVATFRAAAPGTELNIESDDSAVNIPEPQRETPVLPQEEKGPALIDKEQWLTDYPDFFRYSRCLRTAHIKLMQNIENIEINTGINNNHAQIYKDELAKDISRLIKDQNSDKLDLADSITVDTLEQEPLLIIKTLLLSARLNKPLSAHSIELIVKRLHCLGSCDRFALFQALQAGFYYPISRISFFSLLEKYQLTGLIFPELPQILENGSEEDRSYIENFFFRFSQTEHYQKSQDPFLTLFILFWPMLKRAFEDHFFNFELINHLSLHTEYKRLFTSHKKIPADKFEEIRSNHLKITELSLQTNLLQKEENLHEIFKKAFEYFESDIDKLLNLPENTSKHNKEKSYSKYLTGLREILSPFARDLFFASMIFFNKLLLKKNTPIYYSSVISFMSAFQIFQMFKIEELTILPKELKDLKLKEELANTAICIHDYNSYDYPLLFGKEPKQIKRCLRLEPSAEQTTDQSSVGSSDNTKNQVQENSDRISSKTGMLLRDNDYGTMLEDTTRRDFTINALYYDVVTQEIRDYHNGISDLQNKRIDIIGDPVVRYKEDPVRMLRAIRFSAKLNMEITPRTADPIRKYGSLLRSVSNARMYDEIGKMFLLGYAQATFNLMRDFNVFCYIFPSIDKLLNSKEDSYTEKFVNIFLKNADNRVAIGKTGNLCFMYAALLWPEVKSVFEKTVFPLSDFAELNKIAFLSPEDVTPETIEIYNRFVIKLRTVSFPGMKLHLLNEFKDINNHDPKFLAKVAATGKKLNQQIRKIYHTTCTTILNKQSTYTAMPWFSSDDIYQIWDSQVLFYMTKDPSINRLLEFGRFKASLDFLAYRSEINPELGPLFEFWEKAYTKKTTKGN